MVAVRRKGREDRKGSNEVVQVHTPSLVSYTFRFASRAGVATHCHPEWNRTKSPTPGAKRKLDHEKEILLIPPTNAGFQQVTFTEKLQPIQWLKGEKKPHETVLNHIVDTTDDLPTSADFLKLKKHHYYTTLLRALKEMRFLLPAVGPNKYEVYNSAQPRDPPA